VLGTSLPHVVEHLASGAANTALLVIAKHLLE
jgi:hypothetical protein